MDDSKTNGYTIRYLMNGVELSDPSFFLFNGRDGWMDRGYAATIDGEKE